MFKNRFVLAPIVSKELCIAIHYQSNGLYVISCSRVERFLSKYKEELQCGFKQNKLQKFKSNLLNFLRYKSVWTNIDGSLSNYSANTLHYPVVFKVNSQNLKSLNVLFNNMYNENIPLSEKDIKKEYPLLTLYLNFKHE